MEILDALTQVTVCIKKWTENKFLKKNEHVIDEVLNTTSTNPVQNKVITAELDKIPAVKYIEQNLTEEQKLQARSNIGIVNNALGWTIPKQGMKFSQLKFEATTEHTDYPDYHFMTLIDNKGNKWSIYREQLYFNMTSHISTDSGTVFIITELIAGAGGSISPNQPVFYCDGSFKTLEEYGIEYWIVSTVKWADLIKVDCFDIVETPIIVDSALSSESEHPVQNKIVNTAIDDLKKQIGEIDVSSQIKMAIDEATADDFGVYVQDTAPDNAVDGDIWIDTANDPTVIPVDYPDVLPCPGVITFGGAVNANYDGSEDVNVEIPAIPTKTSDLTNDSGYITSVPVQSVNGQTGEVTITASNIGAQPAGDYALQSDLGDLAVKDVVSKSDLASDVQTSLNKANSALQSYTETDPTVPSWAKASTKPTYTAYEVGADSSGTAENKVSAHNTNNAAHNDIRLELQSLANKINAFLDSDDTTLDELSELIIAIKNNKTTIEQLTSGKVNVSDIVNNLTTNVSTKPLSAAQGMELKKLISAITVPTKVSQLTNDKGYISSYTETDPTVPAWAKASSKPTYTNAEVGLGNVDNVKQYSASNPPPYPVTSVNGKTGVVTVNALPSVTASDNGKVLMVVNGQWKAVDLSMSVDANGVLSV